MRLICPSGDRDYYDKMIRYGIDPLVVYVRNREHIKFGFGQDQSMWNFAQSLVTKAFVNTPSSRFGYTHRPNRYADVERCVIGFCGWLYPVLAVRHHEQPSAKDQLIFGFPPPEVSVFYLHSDADVRKFIRKYPDGLAAKSLEKRYLDFNFSPVESLAPFVERDVPLLAIDHEHSLILNPKLETFGFARVKGGDEAFQEISAFISGVLNVGKQMQALPLSDKDKAHSKGFDGMSFRRGPTKRLGPQNNV